MTHRKSFTLLELVIVIVVIGVLSTLGMRHFSAARERAMGQEAVASLQLIASAERIWKMESDTNTFRACSCEGPGTGANQCDNTVNGCNFLLRLNLNGARWHYGVAGVGGTGATATFVATASRVNPGDLANYATCQYRMNQAQTKPQVVTGTTCAYIP